MIDRFKGYGERKIFFTEKISFFLTTGSHKYQHMHGKSENSEIISEFHNDNIIEKSFGLPAQRHHVGLTLFRLGFFGACHKWGVAKMPPSLKSITHILR